MYSIELLIYVPSREMPAHRSHHVFDLGFAGDVGGEGDRGATGFLNLHG